MIPANRQLTRISCRVLGSIYKLGTASLHTTHKKNSKKDKSEIVSEANDILTTTSGIPIYEKNAVLTAGIRGPVLMEDAQYLDEMAHFVRERIPERVVHAKGAGAFGYFVVTDNISKYCAAKVFESVGKKTKIAVRFSTVAGELGSADTVRDVRGFSIKFYTEEGNWDLVGNHTPIFFIRDPILFPSFIHSQKRNPATNLRDPNAVWDFISLRPETIHQVCILFGDRGVPDGYRFMNGYGGHTFKMINHSGHAVYCKFHWKPVRGTKWLDNSEALCIAGKSPDYAIEDLQEAIEDGDFPKWNFWIQVMSMHAAEKCPFNPFDITKVWPHSDCPLIKVGELVLDKNLKNHFAQIEQIAFNPGNMVPGIEPSPDRMLAGRILAYGDAHRHRLGANYQQLPVNRPLKVNNYQRDGYLAFNNQGAGPNYYPNSFNGPRPPMAKKISSQPLQVIGDVKRYDTGDEDNFSQARLFYHKILDDGAKERIVENIAESLNAVTSTMIQKRAIDSFAKIDTIIEKKIVERLKRC